MRKFALFYNPVSGHAAFKGKLDMMVESFQRRNILLLPYRTKAGGNRDFNEFVSELRPDGVLAAGGDGTVHEAANLIVKGGLDLPLGIIGSGTSNDFATHLGINHDLEGYFDRIMAMQTRRCDLGRIGDEYFVNVASAGMLTSIAHEVAPRLKNSLGKLAYYLKGLGELPKIRALPLTVSADNVQQELEAFLFVIINSPAVASMKYVADGVLVDDGKLDFLAVRKCSPVQLMGIMTDLAAGKPVSGKESILHIQAKKFQVSSPVKLESDLDGEAGPLLPLEVETAAKAIEIFC